jgi:hypothetical protein
MSHDDDCFEALDRVSGELRAAEGPKLDWERVETGLFLRIDAEEAKKHGRVARTLVPSGLWRAFGFAAAAAAVMAIGAGATHGSANPAQDQAAIVPATEASAQGPALAPQAQPIAADVLAPAGANGERELLSLHEGDVVEATSAALRFGHAGVVSWSLEPGSRAVIRSLGNAGVGNTVALERGSIRAEVTPRAASEGLIEAFAVEVGGTRVAVHGTAFSVARVGEGAIVDVEHGAVAVGPVGHVGDTSGRLLVGPSRALVSLDGGRAARWLAPASAEKTAAASPVVAPVPPIAVVNDNEAIDEPKTADGDAIASPHGAAFAPPARATATEAAAPAPLPAARQLSRASIEAHIARCFKQVYGSLPDGVSLSFSGSFTVKLDGDGAVLGGKFEPLVRPEVVTCMGSAFDGRFPAGTADFALPVHYGK